MSLTVPGKVLFYGGYSVLLQGHISLSIAVVDSEGKGVDVSWKLGEKRIVSPQFNLDIVPDFTALENKELIAFPYVLTETYLKAKGAWKYDVALELHNSPIFGDKEEKSGLGSSAAATVAVVKALFEANGIDSEAHIETIHKLSQMAYAMYAQKIGSGFDIATASFGKTIIYYRYNPKNIILPGAFNEEEILKAVLLTVEKPWDWLRTQRVSIPAQLLVFNIRGAKTSTISAVKAWKQWKVKNEKEFTRLMKEQHAVEKEAISALLNKDWKKVREYTHRARDVHKKMQEAIANIVPDFDPVEPEPLTQLITEAEKLPGVIAGRCPGAGGWDSVAFLAEEAKQELVDKIIELGKEKGLELKYLPVKVL